MTSHAMTLQSIFPCGGKPFLEHLRRDSNHRASRSRAFDGQKTAGVANHEDVARGWLYNSFDPSTPFLVTPASAAATAPATTSSSSPTGIGTARSDEAMVISRGEMVQLSNTLGGLLALAGFDRPGIRVALIMGNVAEHLPAFLGISFARAVVVPLNPALTAEELDFYLRSNAARLVLTSDDAPFKPTVLAACAKLDISVWSVSIMTNTRDSPTFVMPGYETLPVRLVAECRYGLCVASEGGPLAVPDVSPEDACTALSRLPPCDPDDTLLVLHTSGTTGQAKRVPLRQRQLIWSALQGYVAQNVGPGDRSMVIIPLFHLFGMTAGLLPSLLCGSAMVVAPSFEPGSFLRAVRDHAVTWFSGPPTVHRALLATVEAHLDKMWPAGQVRFIVTGGAPLLRDELTRIHRVLRVQVISAYGMSETPYIAWSLIQQSIDGPVPQLRSGAAAEAQQEVTAWSSRDRSGNVGKGRGTRQQAVAGSKAVGEGGGVTAAHANAEAEREQPQAELAQSNVQDGGGGEAEGRKYEEDAGVEIIQVGVPIAAIDLALMDEHGQPVGGDRERPGEICVRGPGTFDGYEDDPSANEECFHPAHVSATTPPLAQGGRGGALKPMRYPHQRWFRTGDMGFFNQAGCLVMCGRVRDFINRGAMKISPFEVEAAIKQHPRVKDVAAFGVEDALFTQRVAAALILHPPPGDSREDGPPGNDKHDKHDKRASGGRSRDGGAVGGINDAQLLPTHKEMVAFCQKRLAFHKVPSSFFVMDALPVSQLSKVKRAWLGEQAAAGALTLLPWGAEEGDPPQNEMEEKIARVWQHQLRGVLQGRPVRRSDTLLMLGATSLDALAIIAALNRMLPGVGGIAGMGAGGDGGGGGGLALSVPDMLAENTLAQLAVRCQERCPPVAMPRGMPGEEGNDGKHTEGGQGGGSQQAIPLQVTSMPVVADASPTVKGLATGGALATLAGACGAPSGRPTAVSYLQEQMLLFEAAHPGSAAYVAAHVWRSAIGPLDGALLGESLSWLVERHTVLRTRYVLHRPGGGAKSVPGAAASSSGPSGANRGPTAATQVELMQRVVPMAEFILPFSTVDLSCQDPALAEREIQRFVREASTRPFDPYGEPLLRATLVQVGAPLARDGDSPPGQTAEGRRDALVFSVHHSVFDGLSGGVFERELAACYRSLSRHGRPPSLPPLPLQYADFASWQRKRLEGGGEMVRQLDYWARQLADAPLLLDLPTDRPRPCAMMGLAAGTLDFSLGAGTLAGLRQFAAECGSTLFPVLLALWAVVLGRCSRQDKVVIGTPWHGRSSPELLSLIGCFINPLPLCVDVRPDASIMDVVKGARDALFDGMRNADTPVHKLANAMGLRRDPSTSPVFQALVMWNDFGGRLDGCAADPIFSRGGLAFAHAKMDLEVYMGVGRLGSVSSPTEGSSLAIPLGGEGESVDGTLVYRLDLFDRASMRALLGTLGHLARDVAALAVRGQTARVRLRELSLSDAAVVGLNPCTGAVGTEGGPGGEIGPTGNLVKSASLRQAAPSEPTSLPSSATREYSSLVGVSALPGSEPSLVRGPSLDPSSERPPTLCELWARQVAARPDAQALRLTASRQLDQPGGSGWKVSEAGGEGNWASGKGDGDIASITFHQLDRSARRLAHRLVAAGVPPGSTVAVAVDSRVQYVVASLAVWLAGGCQVALDASHPPGYQATLVVAAGPTAVITDRACAARVSAWWPPGSTMLVAEDGDDEGLPDAGVPGSGATAGKGEVDQSAVVAGGEGLFPHVGPDGAAVCSLVPGASDNLATTLLSHRSLLAQLDAYWQAHPFARDDVMLAHSPPASADHLWEVFGALLAGVPAMFAADAEERQGEDREHPSRLASVLASAHVTRAIFSPRLLQDELQDTSFAALLAPGGCLRLCLSAGEPLTPPLARMFLAAARPEQGGCTLVGLFTGGVGVGLWGGASGEVTGASLDAGVVTVGRPWPSVDACVVDAYGHPLPRGLQGELCLAGPALDRGEQASGGGDPVTMWGMTWWRTGEGARVLASGEIALAGRVDGSACVRGAWLHPGWVERAILAHVPEASACAVVLAGGARWGAAPATPDTGFDTGACIQGLDMGACRDGSDRGKDQPNAALTHRQGKAGDSRGQEEREQAQGDGQQQLARNRLPPPPQLVAVVSPAYISLDDVAAALADHLPRHALPSCVVGMPELPRVANGDLDRRQLALITEGAVGAGRDPIESSNDVISNDSTNNTNNNGRSRQEQNGAVAPSGWESSHAGAGADAAPRTPLEERVAAAWRATLGLPVVSAVDNFFAIGGHSLNAVRLRQHMEVADPQLAALLSQRGGSVFTLPTVRDMARAAEEAAAVQGGAGKGAGGEGDGNTWGSSSSSPSRLGVVNERDLRDRDLGRGGEEGDAGVHSPLANAQLMWSYSVVAMHFGHCGGQNLRCFQNTSLRGLWPPHNDTSLANFAPKLFPGGVVGLSVASGLGLARSAHGPQLVHVAYLVLLALLMEFGVCRPFDALATSPGERFSTTAHLWGLWALAFNYLLVLAVVGPGPGHRDRARRRKWLLVAVTLAIMFLLPLLFALIWPPQKAAGERGMWFGPFGMHQRGWQPFGPRIILLAGPFVAGYLVGDKLTRAVAWARRFPWLRVASAAVAVQLAYLDAFFVWRGTRLLDLRDDAQGGRYVNLAGVVADVLQPAAAGGVSYWEQYAGYTQVFLLVTANALLPLVALPANTWGPLAWLTRMPLPSYLLHPLLLRLAEPASFWLLRTTADCVPAAVCLVMLLPLACQLFITWVFYVLERRGVSLGVALALLSASLLCGWGVKAWGIGPVWAEVQ